MTKNKRVTFDQAIYDKHVNADSKMVLDDYELELQARGLSDKTIYQYGADIRLFLVYVYHRMDNRYLLDLKRKDFRRYFLEMQQANLSTARINRMQSSLRNILEYCELDDDDYADYEKNQMKGIKSLAQVDTKDIFFLRDDQVTFLILYLLERQQWQKALYVSLSYDSACRRGEIVQVEKYSFMDKNRSHTNDLIGKGNKRFSLFYMERTRAIAEKWLLVRGEDDIDSLWISDYGGTRSALKANRFYDWVVSFRKILDDAYAEEININPHSFRHSSLENYHNGSHINLQRMERDSLSLNELRVLANHENVSITQGYLKNRDEEMMQELFKMS